MQVTKVVEREEWAGRRWVYLELQVCGFEQSGTVQAAEAVNEEGEVVERVDLATVDPGDLVVDLSAMEACEVGELVEDGYAAMREDAAERMAERGATW